MFTLTTPKLAAALTAGILSIVAISPASAAMGNRPQEDSFISDYCTAHPSANQCQDWRTNRGHWTSNQYQSFYRFHQHDVGFNGNVAAGLFGFVAGAVISTALNNSGAHVTICERTYRSYNVSADTYLGFDGIHHRCTL